MVSEEAKLLPAFEITLPLRQNTCLYCGFFGIEVWRCKLNKKRIKVPISTTCMEWEDCRS